MRYYIPFLITFLVFSCIRHVEEETSVIPYEYEKLEIINAKGFELIYRQDYITILTKSLEENAFFRDSLVIVLNPDFQFENEVKLYPGGAENIAVQSSTHLAYVQQLDVLNTVKGVCGLKYVVNDDVNSVFQESDVKEICNSDQMSRETLLSLNPDLIFTYPFGSAGVETYEEIGLKSLMIAEYLEEDVIARLEWIKLFGLLFKKEKEANQYFVDVKTNYESLIVENAELAEAPSYIMNLPYEDNWYMPAPQSLIVKLFTDAGLEYFYTDFEGTENILLPQEQVWLDGSKSDLWIIIAGRDVGFNKEKLLLENPVYSEFKSFKNDNIFFCNTATKDYFGQGILEPDIMLKDILYLNGDIDNHIPVYFERLK